jgi:hypothetical protein
MPPIPFSQLTDELCLVVEAIGSDAAMAGLKKLRFQDIKFEDDRVKHVVELVSKEMGIPVFEILFGNGRKNDRKVAIGFCTYYLHSPEFYNMDMELVKDHLNKGIIICYKYAKMITRLNPKIVADRSFHEHKQHFDKTFKK